MLVTAPLLRTTVQNRTATEDKQGLHCGGRRQQT